MKLQDAGQQQAGQARVIHQSRGIDVDPDELMLAANVLRRGGVADVPTVTFDTKTSKMHAEFFNPEHCGAHAVNMKISSALGNQWREELQLAANAHRRSGVAVVPIVVEILDTSAAHDEHCWHEHRGSQEIGTIDDFRALGKFQESVSSVYVYRGACTGEPEPVPGSPHVRGTD